MIRKAVTADIPEIVALGARMHAESPRLSRLSYSPSKVAELLEVLIQSDTGFVMVAIRNGEMIGAAMAVITEEWWSWDLVANELAVFVEQNSRGALIAARLIAQMDEWAKSQSRALQTGTTTGVNPERTAQLYEKLGFTRCAIGLERFYH
jgi:GNAT superfamily N-acetyltransferase